MCTKMCFVRSIPGGTHLFLLSDHFHNYNVLKGGMIMEDVSTIVFGVWFLVGAALVFWRPDLQWLRPVSQEPRTPETL